MLSASIDNCNVCHSLLYASTTLRECLVTGFSMHPHVLRSANLKERERVGSTDRIGPRADNYKRQCGQDGNN
ncbi:hypothetical protein M405DRAFT_834363 [Rhizopogon salebrosus TDB-379]|nr:hypothetical protein M405DRAFT_834363 [Rhizopogon salebrosus TDB-379]